MTLPRPLPIRTDRSNTFAHHTMRVRVPAILRDVQADNADYPSRIHVALERLRDDILGDRALEPLEMPAPDFSVWLRALIERETQTWLAAEWFLAEAYFYRRILQATRYWENGRDPFAARKREEMAGEGAWAKLEAALGLRDRPLEERLVSLGRAALWGNRVDLSYAEAASHGDAVADDLLVDHVPQAIGHLLRRPGEVHVITDNAGTELLLDLALVDGLLEGPGLDVKLHVKMMPTFVSDATAVDVRGAIKALEAPDRAASVQALGARLRGAFDEGRLGIFPDLYWNSPRFFFDLPERLAGCFRKASLVISKGDANYRRLTGDALWPPEVPFSAVTAFFPAPLLALRTLKSDSVVGLAPGQAARLDAAHERWRVSGQFGVAQAKLPAREGPG